MVTKGEPEPAAIGISEMARGKLLQFTHILPGALEAARFRHGYPQILKNPWAAKELPIECPNHML